jgi:phospholipid/cholesterol/gamma-HCH transport system substrate-binding protein
MRDVAVGLVVLVALGGLLGLVGLASDGPGFLSPQSTLDVVFRDGQGIRVGSPVRVAGLDAGNVVDLDLVEVEGTLRARVRISLPAHLVKKLREDVKISIQPGLTGMSHVNVVSAGHSEAGVKPGQMIQGVESSFFDPIIEQIGLGPVERNHLSHTIAEVRQTVDLVGPRLRQSLDSLQGTTGDLQEMASSIRPAVEATVNHVESLTRRVEAASPKIESTIGRIDVITGHAQGILTENRQNLRETLSTVRDLTATTNQMLEKNRPKVERLVDGVEVTRSKLDRVLFQADQIAGQGAQIMTRGRAEIERSITNVRDATDWANKLVQKLYTNPFVLSPFYKPSPEDQRVQTVYDAAQVFTKGAQELHDTMKVLEAMQSRATTPEQQREITQLQQNVRAVTERLGLTSQQLAEGLKRPTSTGRGRRQ